MFIDAKIVGFYWNRFDAALCIYSYLNCFDCFHIYLPLALIPTRSKSKDHGEEKVEDR